MSTNIFKNWIKDHKKELILASVSATAGTIGGVKFYKYSRRNVEKFKNEVIDEVEQNKKVCKA